MIWAISLTTMAVRCHRLTPVVKVWVFGVCLELVGRGDPRIQTVALPPRVYYEAAPKGISGRTSYFRVRLAFHSYTQVIRGSCDTHQFGPPAAFRLPSSCPCIAHPVSGFVPATIRRPIRTRFRSGSGYCSLSHATENKVVGSLCKRHAVTRLRGLQLICTQHISETISSPFRGAFHLSLTVLSAIDLCTYLALDGGPPSFRPDYTCPTLLRNSLPCHSISRTGLSPSMAARSRDVLLWNDNQISGSYNPSYKYEVWADPCSLATTRGISVLISFVRVTEMFQFTQSISLRHLRVQSTRPFV